MASKKKNDCSQFHTVFSSLYASIRPRFQCLLKERKRTASNLWGDVRLLNTAGGDISLPPMSDFLNREFCDLRVFAQRLPRSSLNTQERAEREIQLSPSSPKDCKICDDKTNISRSSDTKRIPQSVHHFTNHIRRHGQAKHDQRGPRYWCTALNFSLRRTVVTSTANRVHRVPLMISARFSTHHCQFCSPTPEVPCPLKWGRNEDLF